jgi:hypothetical protein
MRPKEEEKHKEKTRQLEVAGKNKKEKAKIEFGPSFFRRVNKIFQRWKTLGQISCARADDWTKWAKIYYNIFHSIICFLKGQPSIILSLS